MLSNGLDIAPRTNWLIVNKMLQNDFVNSAAKEIQSILSNSQDANQEILKYFLWRAESLCKESAIHSLQPFIKEVCFLHSKYPISITEGHRVSKTFFLLIKTL